jgi:hypothetical protein
MPDSIVMIVTHIAAAVMGGYLAYSWFRSDINRLFVLKKAGRWETPEDFKNRTGSSLPGEAAVYCRWKKDGPMYRKLKALHKSKLCADPDTWGIHTYNAALSIGHAHGESKEILCANSDMGCPPPKCESPVVEGDY